MKRVIYFIVVLVFIVSCSDEYQPGNYYPDVDGGIEEVFPDSIAGLKSNTKFDFMNDSCKSISATYGDKSDIYIQILLVDFDYSSPKECISNYIMPQFKEFAKIKKNYNEFQVTASNDDFNAFTWYEDEFVFFLKCHNKYLDAIVRETSYLKYK
ncbi:MAG: hypothetical protein JXR68_01310 [Bacteroidales bacterium]|nr:hypothetical protein [Bacteroidales bacterium]